MAYFDELLQRAITVRNNRAPASNTADLVGGVLVGIVTALQMLLDDKQDELTFDTAPTADSQNPVTSDGIYQALQAIDLSACEKIVNKVTSINAQSTNVQYPSAKLLYDSLQALSGIYAAIQHTHAIADIINLQTELDARQLVSNLVTAITAQSTDQQYPSAKLLYDQLQGLAAVYAPKVHTHPFADIERPANVASVNAQGYTITTAYYSHVLTITADATLHLPTMQGGAAIILRLTIIQDATGGRAVTFDGGAALVFNPYQTDLSLGQANYRCWVVLWFDGVNWAWLASPYVLRAESQFAYTIDGTTGGQYVTVTINGTTMQIQATSGVWQYGYNNPINSIAFTGDTGVLNVDFTNSDGLANITTLADAFKNCAALVAVDFTGCDLSNVATAADCFAGCTSLAALTIPTGTWKPDIDLSACATFTKAAMLAVIDGLYTYASGTHTVTFNSTAWDALSQADQQQVYNAADAKGWTTNAVAVTYVIRGTSSNVGGTESFYLRFVGGLSNTQITVNVDANGEWEYQYTDNKLNVLRFDNNNFSQEAYNDTLLTIDLREADDFMQLEYAEGFVRDCRALTAIYANQTFENVVSAKKFFWICGNGVDVQMPNMTLENANCETFFGLFYPKDKVFSHNKLKFDGTFTAFNFIQNCPNLEELHLPNATFANVTSCHKFIITTLQLKVLDLPTATFANATTCADMFNGQSTQNLWKLEQLIMPKATFASATDCSRMFYYMGYQSASHNTLKIDMPLATFANVGNAQFVFGAYGGKEINMPLATFGTMSNFTFFCNECAYLTKVNLTAFTGQNATTFDRWFINSPNISNLALAQSALNSISVSFQWCELSYNSMISVCGWLKDLTGSTAKTVTFKTSAWNALTAAEQSNIDTILSGKNWTRVLG